MIRISLNHDYIKTYCNDRRNTFHLTCHQFCKVYIATNDDYINNNYTLTQIRVLIFSIHTFIIV